jgi:uncharacterized ion transporter superfamily protein YfcC
MRDAWLMVYVSKLGLCVACLISILHYTTNYKKIINIPRYSLAYSSTREAKKRVQSVYKSNSTRKSGMW